MPDPSTAPERRKPSLAARRARASPTTDAPQASQSGSRANRIVDAVFGVFFLGLAAAIALLPGSGTRVGALVAVLILGALGAEAVFSALRRRRSWLSRLGPLP